MSIVQAVILGLVQGLTEFLPVSSSGHLVLVPELAGWAEPGLPFLVLLHAATLLAVLVYFRRELKNVLAGIGSPGPARRFVLLVVVATGPAAVLGLIFKDWFESVFSNPVRVALQLMGTGLILLGAEALVARRGVEAEVPADAEGIEPLTKLSGYQAVGIGFAQALAIFPGISRAGSTIAGGLLAGLSRAQAARFSFLMAIPILAGTAAYEVPNLAGGEVGAGAMFAGFASAAVSGYVAIAFMVSMLKRRRLTGFAVYCIAAGAAAAAWLLWV